MPDLALTVRRLAAVGRSGVLTARPDVLVRVAREARLRGPVAGACVGAAARWGDRPVFSDEFGTLTARQVDERSNALARALVADGARAGDTAAILCRNHRGFLDATFAAMKVGMRCVFLNTEFAGPQIDDVCRREDARTLLFDAEYAGRAPTWADRHLCTLTEGGTSAVPTTEDLIGRHSGARLDPPAQLPSMVILTSGTTGTPKGAPREEVKSLDGLAALLDRVPLRTAECTYVAPPFFHALGFAHLLLGLTLGSRVVTRRRFDAQALLADVAAEQVTALIVVPAMLQRALELGPDALRGHDLSALRVIFCSGSQLPGHVASQVLDAFGDVLYVLYGSTEVAYATISTPADHRAAPATVGRPCLGVDVRLLDDDSRPVTTAGATGRIFVTSGTAFGGYTDGTNKEIVGGAMSSGDVGHFDAAGRLFIDGRDDDMIVSGGENVFPMEVEELLIRRDDVAEVAVVGVDDEQFGKRLVAFVVPMDGSVPTEDDMKAFVKENLARYKVPREVHFLHALPRNATGKILKRELLGSLT